MKDTSQVVEGLFEILAQETPGSLSEMEQSVREGILELGRQTLERWACSLEESYPAERLMCDCGQEAEYRCKRETTLRTMFGQVKVRRAYYLCPDCHRGSYPLDRQLGLRPNAMSAGLERLAGMVGVEVPFGQGSQLLEKLTLVSLSDHSLDKAAQAYGEEMIQQEGEWQAEAGDMVRMLERQRTVHPPRRLYGSLDGGRVHIRGEGGEPDTWRELKVGAWYEARGRPPSNPDGEWTIRAENITYYADICSAETFSDLVWATGVQRHAQFATELVFLGDGARWIWDIVAQHFPKATQIVDWFHACEYLMPVAQAAFRSEEQRLAWIEHTKTALWEGCLDDVIAACQALVNPNREDDPAQRAVTYYSNNRHRMDYPTYRANGYHIGSGAIESGIKQIGSQRMKVAGARWNLVSARKVAKARAAYLSGFWNDLAARRTHLPRAA